MCKTPRQDPKAGAVAAFHRSIAGQNLPPLGGGGLTDAEVGPDKYLKIARLDRTQLKVVRVDQVDERTSQ